MKCLYRTVRTRCIVALRRLSAVSNSRWHGLDLYFQSACRPIKNWDYYWDDDSDEYWYRQITAEEHITRTNKWVTDYWRRPTYVWRQRSLTIDLQALINSHWARNNPSRIAERLWVDRWRVKTVDIGTVTLCLSGLRVLKRRIWVTAEACGTAPTRSHARV